MECVVAVDLGATNTRVALVGEAGEIVRRISVATPRGEGDPRAISDHLIRSIRHVLATADPGTIGGIGIGAAGPVDLERGGIVNPPNMDFAEIPLVQPLEEAFGAPVRLVNDCHAGIVGEALFGAARGYEHAVYVTLSTGLGAGILAGGRLLLGRRGYAGEIGHIAVDEQYGVPCGCGHSGHWEGYASGRRKPMFFDIWRRAREREHLPFNPRTAEEIFAAARKGDALAREFVEEVGRINARGLSAIVVAYDPAVIVLDGSIALNNPDLVLPPLNRCMDRFLPLPPIRLSSLEGLAPLLGASVIARGYDTPFGSLANVSAEPRVR